MRDQIEEWLKDRKETIGKKTEAEYRYMIVVVLYWGFLEVLKALKTQGMSPKAADSERDADFYKDHPV